MNYYSFININDTDYQIFKDNFLFFDLFFEVFNTDYKGIFYFKDLHKYIMLITENNSYQIDFDVCSSFLKSASYENYLYKKYNNDLIQITNYKKRVFKHFFNINFKESKINDFVKKEMSQVYDLTYSS